MQQYLRKARLSTILDDVGLRLVIAAAGVGWFVFLWGLTVPALLAGAALAILGQMALNHYRRSSVHRREAALRMRLGGEMLMEEMLLAPPRQAHMQATLLLGGKYPLCVERLTDGGAVCQSGGEKLLIACVAIPEGSEAGEGALLQIQRVCREQGAARGVACVTGRVSAKTEAWAAEAVIPVKVIRRETLLHLAGAMYPATDAQLVALGRRRKRLAPSGIRRTILRRDKAKRYFFYGVAMLLIYIVTGLRYYPIPGAICLALCVGCRLYRSSEERL